MSSPVTTDTDATQHPDTTRPGNDSQRADSAHKQLDKTSSPTRLHLSPFVRVSTPNNTADNREGTPHASSPGDTTTMTAGLPTWSSRQITWQLPTSCIMVLIPSTPKPEHYHNRKVFGGRRQVADWSPTGWWLIDDQLQRLQTIPTQFLVADWSPTSRRLVADWSPKSCRLSAIKNKRSKYRCQPVADRLPIGCRSLPNWSPTDRRRVGNRCPITRQYSINIRSLSAPEPMLDLFSVNSSDIDLKAISWRQLYRDTSAINH